MMTYKFCNKFEGDFVNNEYIMLLTAPQNCGKILNNKACMCAEHINYNQQVVLDIKLSQTKSLIALGIEEEEDYEEILERGLN